MEENQSGNEKGEEEAKKDKDELLFTLSPATKIYPKEVTYISPNFDLKLDIIGSNNRSLENSVFANRPDIFFLRELDEPLLEVLNSKGSNDFLEYATKEFTTHTKGFTKKQVPVEQLVVFSKEPLKKGLLKMPEKNHELLKEIGKGMFMDLLCLMGEESTKLQPRDHAKQFLEKMKKDQSLHDEAICQIMKQLNKNKKYERTLNGWYLLLIVLTTILPSEKLEPVLIKFIYEAMEEEKEKGKSSNTATEYSRPGYTPLYSICSGVLSKLHMSLALGGRDGRICEELLAGFPSDLVTKKVFDVGLEDIMQRQINAVDTHLQWLEEAFKNTPGYGSSSSSSSGSNKPQESSANSGGRRLIQSSAPSKKETTQIKLEENDIKNRMSRIKVHVPNYVFLVPKVLCIFVNSINVPLNYSSQDRVEKLFGKQGPKDVIEQLKKQINEENYVYFGQDNKAGIYSRTRSEDGSNSQSECDPVVVVSIMKTWLRSLHESLIPRALANEITNEKGEKKTQTMCESCRLLEDHLNNIHFYTLKYLIRLLRKV